MCVVGIKTRNKENKLFNCLLVFAIINMCFDIASNYTVNHLEEVPPMINRVVHMAFYVSMITLFLIVYKYLVALIETELGYELKGKILSSVPYIILSVLAMILPLKYMVEETGNWSYGPALSAVYACVGIYVVLIVGLIIKYRNKISSKNKLAIILALFCELGAASFQIFVPAALTSSLGVVLLCLCMYMTVANPDAVLVGLLKKETQRADTANRAKSDFLAKMSHEIRTPINAVLGMNEMIIRESKEEDIKKYALDIRNSAKGLLSIINEILDSSKIESGKMEIVEDNYDISSLINDLYNMIVVKARDKDLELIFDIAEDIPSGYFGDDIRIRQVLINLLNNAVKYTQKGSVTLTLTGRREGENEILLYSIKDTGIGIREEDIDKLFSKFERIEEKRNRYIEGTGLGMNIVIQLLKLMGSELKVKSEYGKGSEFYFELVQKVVNEDAVGDFKERISKTTIDNTYEVSYRAPEAKILVVDDNEMNRKVFKNLIKQTDICVSEADSGKECIRKVENERFDMIFLDHMMPEMDGVETLRHMKKQLICEGIPVIMLTANAIKGAKEQYLSEGFDDFLTKPISPVKLDEMIIKYLPEELILSSESMTQDDKEEEIEELPELEEFDFEYAIKILNSRDLLMSTLEDFHHMLMKLPDKLNKSRANLEDEEAIMSYRIEVHSLKSVSATVGAILLSKLARMLEVAAIQNDVEKIITLHPILLDEIEKHIARVETILPKRDNSLEAANIVVFNMHLQMLKKSLEEFDYDTADLISDEICKYQYPDNLQPLVDELQECIRDLLTEDAIKIIEKLNTYKNSGN